MNAEIKTSYLNIHYSLFFIHLASHNLAAIYMYHLPRNITRII
jgi:hypothetical protein